MKTKILSLISLLFLVGFSFLTGCNQEEITTVPDRPQSTSSLIDNQILRPAELELGWAHAMPLSGDEKLGDFEIIDGRLYAVSSHNYLMSFDLNIAKPVYGWKLAADSDKINGLQKYSDSLYSIISTDLVAMDLRSGIRQISKRLGFGPLCPPARNDDFYYIAGTDQRVHVLQASDFVQVFEASANDNSDITCVDAKDSSVIFSTKAGNVVAMWPGQATQIWRFKADKSINSPIVRDNRQVIFSSEDAYIYCVDEFSGRLIWRYLTSALLSKAPVVTQKYVYQSVDGVGLVVIDRQSGKVAWQLPGGVALLAENGPKTYVMTADRELVVMDTQNKRVGAKVKLPMISRWVSNVDGSNIYLADDYGRIVCIKPIEY